MTKDQHCQWQNRPVCCTNLQVSARLLDLGIPGATETLVSEPLEQLVIWDSYGQWPIEKWFMMIVIYLITDCTILHLWFFVAGYTFTKQRVFWTPYSSYSKEAYQQFTNIFKSKTHGCSIYTNHSNTFTAIWSHLSAARLGFKLCLPNGWSGKAWHQTSR